MHMNSGHLQLGLKAGYKSPKRIYISAVVYAAGSAKAFICKA